MVHDSEGRKRVVQRDVGDLQAKADTWNAKGNAYLALRDYGTAISCFNLALQTQSESAKKDVYLSNRATALFRIGEYEQAVEEFKRASELCPQNHGHLTCLGKVYLRWGGHEVEALEALNRSLSIEHTTAASNLAAKAQVALDRIRQHATRPYPQISPSDVLGGVTPTSRSPENTPMVKHQVQCHKPARHVEPWQRDQVLEPISEDECSGWQVKSQEPSRVDTDEFAKNWARLQEVKAREVPIVDEEQHEADGGLATQNERIDRPEMIWSKDSPISDAERMIKGVLHGHNPANLRARAPRKFARAASTAGSTSESQPTKNIWISPRSQTDTMPGTSTRHPSPPKYVYPPVMQNSTPNAGWILEKEQREVNGFEPFKEKTSLDRSTKPDPWDKTKSNSPAADESMKDVPSLLRSQGGAATLRMKGEDIDPENHQKAEQTELQGVEHERGQQRGKEYAQGYHSEENDVEEKVNQAIANADVIGAGEDGKQDGRRSDEGGFSSVQVKIDEGSKNPDPETEVQDEKRGEGVVMNTKTSAGRREKELQSCDIDKSESKSEFDTNAVYCPETETGDNCRQRTSSATVASRGRPTSAENCEVTLPRSRASRTHKYVRSASLAVPSTSKSSTRNHAPPQQGRPSKHLRSTSDQLSGSRVTLATLLKNNNSAGRSARKGAKGGRRRPRGALMERPPGKAPEVSTPSSLKKFGAWENTATLRQRPNSGKLRRQRSHEAAAPRNTRTETRSNPSTANGNHSRNSNTSTNRETASSVADSWEATWRGYDFMPRWKNVFSMGISPWSTPQQAGNGGAQDSRSGTNERERGDRGLGAHQLDRGGLSSLVPTPAREKRETGKGERSSSTSKSASNVGRNSANTSENAQTENVVNETSESACTARSSSVVGCTEATAPGCPQRKSAARRLVHMLNHASSKAPQAASKIGAASTGSSTTSDVVVGHPKANRSLRNTVVGSSSDEDGDFSSALEALGRAVQQPGVKTFLDVSVRTPQGVPANGTIPASVAKQEALCSEVATTAFPLEAERELVSLGSTDDMPPPDLVPLPRRGRSDEISSKGAAAAAANHKAKKVSLDYRQLIISDQASVATAATYRYDALFCDKKKLKRSASFSSALVHSRSSSNSSPSREGPTAAGRHSGHNRKRGDTEKYSGEGGQMSTNESRVIQDAGHEQRGSQRSERGSRSNSEVNWGGGQASRKKEQGQTYDVRGEGSSNTGNGANEHGGNLPGCAFAPDSIDHTFFTDSNSSYGDCEQRASSGGSDDVPKGIANDQPVKDGPGEAVGQFRSFDGAIDVLSASGEGHNHGPQALSGDVGRGILRLKWRGRSRRTVSQTRATSPRIACRRGSSCIQVWHQVVVLEQDDGEVNSDVHHTKSSVSRTGSMSAFSSAFQISRSTSRRRRFPWSKEGSRRCQTFLTDDTTKGKKMEVVDDKCPQQGSACGVVNRECSTSFGHKESRRADCGATACPSGASTKPTDPIPVASIPRGNGTCGHGWSRNPRDKCSPPADQ